MPKVATDGTPTTRVYVQPVKQERHPSSGEKAKPCTHEEEEATIQGTTTIHFYTEKDKIMASIFFNGTPTYLMYGYLPFHLTFQRAMTHNVPRWMTHTLS